MVVPEEFAMAMRSPTPGRPAEIQTATPPRGSSVASTATLSLLANAIMQIREAVVITDASAAIQFVNPAFSRITGYSAEEAIGQSTRLLKSDRQDPAFYGALWKTVLSGQVWQGELLNRRKDGTLYVDEMSITPVRDGSGAITNFIAIKQDVTEHRATEAQLWSSEKKLQEARHITILGGWELDERASEFHGSEGFSRIFDWPPGPVVVPFRKVLEAIPEGDRERLDTVLRSALQSREPFDVEHRVVRGDGTMRVVRSRGQAVADQDGHCLRLVGTSHDITDFRLAHEQLRQSEEKFRSLVANLPDVTWSSSVDGQTQYISPNVDQVYGFTAAEICEKNPALRFGRIHPDDASRILDGFHQLFAQGHPFDVEYRVRHKDGRWIWIHDRAYRTYDKDGVSYADGLFFDITERKLAEEVRERLAAVVDSSDDAILSKTLNGTITAWNPSAESLFGYSSAEAVGRTIQMLLPADRADEESDILRRIARGEHVRNFETVRIRKDGTRVDISATISPIKNGIGVVVGASKIARDITDRKRAEEEMRKAKEDAESANRAKSQFLANMSHEIRTPMNGVIGVAGLLLDTELTPEQRQYAGIIRTSGETLLKVINDILDFSKIEARKLTLETADFDLRTVLQDAAAVLAIKASEKGLALTCQLEPGTPSLLRGDPGRVRQIMLNLLGNSVKFTPAGKVAASVRLEAEDEHAVTLRFSVTDTGIGFRQDRAATLFDPFVQGDGSSTRRYGGTGLGLTISRQLVEMMGGRIGAESEEGQGSTFWFTSVFEKQTSASTSVLAKETATTPSASFGRAPLVLPGNRPARILVAEDNPINQEVMVAILRRLGYESDVAGNGTKALHALQHSDYDAVLMDGAMPEMNGYEATRLIREGKGGRCNPKIPIIAVTADAMSADRHKCLEAGMNDYLAKPIEPWQLATVLQKWLPQPVAGVGGDYPPAPSSAERTPVFNEKEMLARLMGDRALARKIISAFLSDAPHQLRTLKTRLEEGDADGARLQAHTLKGASATVSAEALHALCFEAQEAAAQRQLKLALTLLPRLDEQLDLLKAALKQSGWT